MRWVARSPYLLAGLLLLCARQAAVSAQEISADQLDFFERKVRPVLVEHCYSCHSAGAEKLKGGFLLDTREGALKGGTSGEPAVVPGDVGRSALVRGVRGEDPEFQMPPKEKLSAQQIADLVAWVEMGAPDPREGASHGVAQPVDAKTFWAFQPPRDHPAPAVKDAAWARNDVDRFILAKLEEKKLGPSLEADRRTLIRRATFDLTGLPPTADEVEAFVADASADAYDRLIERLLASPRYGERWGRHWLDLARYSDTKGYVYEGREERRFVHSHVYRDWVIGAFNEDKPYDRFLMEQIAADQLDYGDTTTRQAALPAMGFATIGRRFLGVVPDIVDDRIDVLTRTTQGLTVACARCHDHKFDPIPTADYYSLYGVFEGSTERSVPVELQPPRTPEFEKYEAGLNERVKKLQDTFAAKRDAFEAKLREKSGEYLVAVLDADKLPPDVFYEIRDANDLIPTIVRQWQRHLMRSAGGNDPIFTPWHAVAALQAGKAMTPDATVTEMKRLTGMTRHPVNGRVVNALMDAKPASMKDVAATYGRLFVEAENAWKELVGKDPAATRLPEPELEALRQVLYGPGTPARVPQGSIVDVEWFFDEPTRVELGGLQKAIDNWQLTAAGAPPQAVVLEDKPEQRTPRVFKRGNPSTPGEEVPRQYLAVVSGAKREPFKQGSGRLELARAIASKDNPLTARVMANRIWLHHFGAGLVDTPSDFGVRSDPPSHPELLDWLAIRFVEQGWSVKQMHRLLMRSATYRQLSSDANATAAAADPQNRLLWRMNRARLDFEGLRDSLLAASGELDPTMGGRPADVNGPRRSVYLLVDRQFLPGVFRVFDFANPDLHIPQRGATTIPQQALFFMNGKFVTERAKALASRAHIADAPDDAERVRGLYRVVYQRPATEAQVSAGVEFVNAAEVPAAAPPPAPVATAWEYGYGEYHSSADRIKGFTKLPHFTGEAWQGGNAWPDAMLGWVQLTATGGHAGDDLAHAAVRRWVAPRDMTVRIDGTVLHKEAPGDGVAARILSSRHGTLGRWQVHNTTAETKVEQVEVKQGDTIDFVVDLLGNLNSDMFTWAPALFQIDPAVADGSPAQWVAKSEFAGPTPAPPEPLDAWAMYAQVLLLSNEFVFVD